MTYFLLVASLSLAQAAARERKEAVALAVSTLAEKLDISEDAVVLESNSKVTWPDAGLGCPEDGVRRDPAPTPGYRVLLRVDSRRYRVHVASERAVICEEPREVEEDEPPEAPSAPREKADPLAPVVEAARKDLAGRLSVEAERIEVVEARSMVWPDGSLGCPEPGRLYTQALQDGALVRLRYGSEVYAYHSGRRGEPFLCGR
jgi:hypothetical protein